MKSEDEIICAHCGKPFERGETFHLISDELGINHPYHYHCLKEVNQWSDKDGKRQQ